MDEHNGREAFALYQMAMGHKWNDRMWTKMNKRKRAAWIHMARTMIKHIQEGSTE